VTTYDDAVAKAARALKTGEDANWLLARLTHDNTSGEPGPRKKSAVALVSAAQWATDIRRASGRAFGTTSARLYRRIWVAHGTAYQAGQIDWATAYEQTRGESADERMGDFNLTRGLEHATVEARREAFVNLAQDEEVLADKPTVQRVDRHVRPIANLAEAERRELEHKALDDLNEQLITEDPAFKSLDQTGALLDLSRGLRHFYKEVSPLIARLPKNETPGEGHMFLRFEYDRAEGLMHAIKAFLDHGQTDLDAFISETLKG